MCLFGTKWLLDRVGQKPPSTLLVYHSTRIKEARIPCASAGRWRGALLGMRECECGHINVSPVDLEVVIFFNVKLCSKISVYNKYLS